METPLIYIFSANFVCDINWERNTDKLGRKVSAIKAINVHVLSPLTIRMVSIHHTEFRNENKNIH